MSSSSTATTMPGSSTTSAASGSAPRPTPCVIGRSPTRTARPAARDDVVPSGRRQLAASGRGTGEARLPPGADDPASEHDAPRRRDRHRGSRTRSSSPSSAVMASNAGVVTRGGRRPFDERGPARGGGRVRIADGPHRRERVGGDRCRVAQRHDLLRRLHAQQRAEHGCRVDEGRGRRDRREHVAGAGVHAVDADARRARQARYRAQQLDEVRRVPRHRRDVHRLGRAHDDGGRRERGGCPPARASLRR